MTINDTNGQNGRNLKEDNTFYNLADAFEMSMGGRGCVVIKDTNKTDSKAGYAFIALHCITETTIAAYTTRGYAPVTPENALNAIAFPAGTVLYGQFTSITLTSGTAIAYYGVNNAGS